MKTSRSYLIAIIATLRFAAQAGAQAAAPAQADPDALLHECIRLADAAGTDESTGKAAGERAEQFYRERLKLAPKDLAVRVSLAHTLSRCRIPYAGMMQKLSLVNESSELLQSVLAVDSTHWEARFILAMNYKNVPAFLGKTDDAVEQLEKLLAQQGARADAPYFALTYIHLGEMYERTGRTAQAVTVWKRGAALFPNEPRLREKSAKAMSIAPAPVAPADTVQPAAAVKTEAPQNELPPVYALTPLTVEASNYQLSAARSGSSLKRLDVVTMPGGTGDMLQALQTLPGTTRASDGSDLYVRGGEAAETAILLDGGRVPYAGRWEGLNGGAMGVLDAMVLRKAYFSAGGFSAKYGNALSGVVDVEAEGRPQQSSWGAGANIVQLGGRLQRRLGTRTGFWGAASATDVTLLAKMNGQGDLYSDAPRSVQGIAGVSFEPRKGIELRALGVNMTDVVEREIDGGGYHGTFASRGTTRHASLSLRALRADGKAGVTSSATASLRNSGFDFGVLDRVRRDRSLAMRVDGDITPAFARIRSGIEFAALDAKTDGSVPTTGHVSPGSPARALDTKNQSTVDAGAYVEAERPLWGGLILAAGVRADRLPGEDRVTVDPRLALAYTTDDWTLRLGTGMFHQGRWRLRYTLPGTGAPGGIPTSAQHLVAGVEHAGEPSLRVEGYIKKYGDYIEDGDGEQAQSGRTIGMDGIVRWSQQSRLNGWVTYSLARGRVSLADGARVPSSLDITHTLTAVGRFAVNDNWELGSTVRYGSGRPYTPVVGATQDEQSQLFAPTFGDVNAGRVPAFARLDARITRYVQLPRAFLVLYLEMLNLTDRRNVTSYTYDASYTDRIPVETFFAHRSFVLGFDLQATKK